MDMIKELSSALLLSAALIWVVSCASEPTPTPPPAREFPNATDLELKKACEVLSTVSYEFERMSSPWTPITTKRVVEVAAMIDWDYPGPHNARGFCRRHASRR